MDSTALCLRWLDTEKLWFWLVKVCIRWKTQPEENGFRQLVCFQKKGRQISFNRTFTRASELWLLKFDAFLSVKCQYKLPSEKKKKFSCCPEEYWLHEECFCVSLPMPTKYYHYLYHSHYCPIPDSFCHLRQWNNHPWLFEEPRSFSSSAPWLTNDFAKSNTVSCRIKKRKGPEIESWPLSAISSVIFSILMSIMFMDYLAVFCSLALLVQSDRSLGATAPLIMSLWLMGLIV